MPDPGFRAVIFDLDGTLLNTLADIAYSINTVMELHGFEGHPVDDFGAAVGSGLKVAIERLLPAGVPEETIASMAADVNRIYARDPAGRTFPYPGIPELLTRLETDGIPMSVLSNKPHDLVVPIVEQLLGEWDFAGVLGQRDGHRRKPDPADARELAARMGSTDEATVFVGDSDIDMQTASNAGMYAVGVGWGFRTVNELENAGARMIVSDPQEISRLLV